MNAVPPPDRIASAHRAPPETLRRARQAAAAAEASSRRVPVHVKFILFPGMTVFIVTCTAAAAARGECAMSTAGLGMARTAWVLRAERGAAAGPSAAGGQLSSNIRSRLDCSQHTCKVECMWRVKLLCPASVTTTTCTSSGLQAAGAVASGRRQQHSMRRGAARLLKP